MVTKEIMINMAELAKLSFSEDELNNLAGELNEIINSFQTIEEVNTDNVEPTYQVNDNPVPLRVDKKGESLPLEDVVRNTAEEQYGYFKILKVVD